MKTYSFPHYWVVQWLPQWIAECNRSSFVPSLLQNGYTLPLIVAGTVRKPLPTRHFLPFLKTQKRSQHHSQLSQDGRCVHDRKSGTVSLKLCIIEGNRLFRQKYSNCRIVVCPWFHQASVARPSIILPIALTITSSSCKKCWTIWIA